MALKASYPFIIYLLLFLLLSPNHSGGLNACSIQKSIVPIDLWGNDDPPNSPGMVELYGEVTAISATQINIDTGIRQYQFPLSPHVRIHCNGLPAVWSALRPVTSEAFFEAKVWVSEQNEAISVAGAYFGEICVLQSWRMEHDKLFLKLSAADSSRTYWRKVAPGAKIPDTDWLAEDMEIYVLYNYEQNIRAVFFPKH